MDASKLEPFLLLAKSAKGRAAAEIVYRSTSEPNVYAFGELLEAPGIKELQAEDAAAYRLLQLFCYGTWTEYKGTASCDCRRCLEKFESKVLEKDAVVNFGAEDAASLPKLSQQQQIKLKQLTVVSMAGVCKKLQYADLLAQLEVQNVRELEDLLISECFYPGLVKGKLDQRQRCLHVEEAVARDIRPENLKPMIDGLASWLQNSQAVLARLEDNMAAVQEAGKAIKDHQATLEAGIEGAKQALKGGEGSSKDAEMQDDMGTLDMMELEDRSAPPAFGGRPKRRR